MPKATARVDWGLIVMLGLLSLATFLVMLRLFLSRSQNAGWVDASLLTVAIAGTILALAKQLPVVNVIFAAVMAGGIGGVAHAVNDVTGFPFGRLEFTTALGPRFLGILPLAMPCFWAIIALSTRGAARFVLRSSRAHPVHGYHVVGLAAALMVTLQMTLSAFGSAVMGWWLPPAAPIIHLISWIVISFAIQIVITPLLIDKFPRTRPPNFWPLSVWLAMNVLLILSLFTAGRMAEALLAVTISGTIIVLALRSENGTVAPTARIT